MIQIIQFVKGLSYKQKGVLNNGGITILKR